MSEFVQATLDAILLLKSARSHASLVHAAHRLVDDAIMWLEIDLRNYLTGK